MKRYTTRMRRMVDALGYRHNDCCRYCGNKVTSFAASPKNKATMDHVTPRAMGGSIISNLVLACERCNVAKGARSIEEFMALICGVDLHDACTMISVKPIRLDRAANIDFRR